MCQLRFKVCGRRIVARASRQSDCRLDARVGRGSHADILAALCNQHQRHTFIGRVSRLKYRHALARMFIKRRAERANCFLELVGAGFPLAKEGECIAEIILGGCPQEGNPLARVFLEGFAIGGHSLLEPNGADLPLPKGCERVTQVIL